MDHQGLRSIIESFKVTHLQLLLSEAGLSRAGKKTELKNRALDLLKQRPIPEKVINKIIELNLNRPPGIPYSNNSSSINNESDTLRQMNMMPHDSTLDPMSSSNIPIAVNSSTNNTRMCTIVDRPDHNILTGLPEYQRAYLQQTQSRGRAGSSLYQPSTQAVRRPSNSLVHHGRMMQQQIHHVPPHHLPNYQIPTYQNHYINHQSHTNNHIPDIGGNHLNPYGINNIHQPTSFLPQTLYTTATPVNEPSKAKFKGLPFFPMLEEIVQPCCLIPTNRSNRPNESTISFSLTVTQADKIGMSALSTNPKQWQYSRQILLRFCSCDTQLEQDDNFPPDLSVEVNNKPVELPPALHNPNKPDKQIRRTGKHVDITGASKLCPYVKNHIMVKWSSDLQKTNRTYAITVVLVKKLNSNDLLQDIMSRGLSNQELTRSMVKEKLTADADSEIATTALRATLICPLGKMRMRTPCRSSQCHHIQCFDALLYLQMNERKPSWICPVCDQPALFKDLIIDGLFTDILKETSTLTTDIQFYENGSWSVVPKNEDTYSKDIKPYANKRQCLESGGYASGSNGKSECQNRKPEIEVVIISDSDDNGDENDEKESDKTSRASGSVYSISSSSETDIPDLPELSPRTVDANIYDSHPVTSSVFVGNFESGPNGPMR